MKLSSAHTTVFILNAVNVNVFQAIEQPPSLKWLPSVLHCSDHKQCFFLAKDLVNRLSAQRMSSVDEILEYRGVLVCSTEPMVVVGMDEK